MPAYVIITALSADQVFPDAGIDHVITALGVTGIMNPKHPGFREGDHIGFNNAAVAQDHIISETSIHNI